MSLWFGALASVAYYHPVYLDDELGEIAEICVALCRLVRGDDRGRPGAHLPVPIQQRPQRWLHIC
jgi:hypothetical protein